MKIGIILPAFLLTTGCLMGQDYKPNTTPTPQQETMMPKQGMMKQMKEMPKQGMMGKMQEKAKEMAKPQVTEMKGEVIKVVSALEEKKIGNYRIGTYILVKGENGETYTWHLGPAALVDEMVNMVKPNQPIVARVFQISMLPKNEYIVVDLTYQGKKIQFRDTDLVPFWAEIDGDELIDQ